MTIELEDFLKVDVRVGTVVSAAPNPAARKPAYVLEVDFGPELGRRTASAQLTELYTPAQLLGRQVAAIVAHRGAYYPASTVVVETGWTWTPSAADTTPPPAKKPRPDALQH